MNKKVAGVGISVLSTVLVSHFAGNNGPVIDIGDVLSGNTVYVDGGYIDPAIVTVTVR